MVENNINQNEKLDDITERILYSNNNGSRMLGLGFIGPSVSIEDAIQTRTNLMMKRFFHLKRNHANLYDSSNTEELQRAQIFQ